MEIISQNNFAVYKRLNNVYIFFKRQGHFCLLANCDPFSSTTMSTDSLFNQTIKLINHDMTCNYIKKQQ